MDVSQPIRFNIAAVTTRIIAGITIDIAILAPKASHSLVVLDIELEAVEIKKAAASEPMISAIKLSLLLLAFPCSLGES